MLRSRAVVKVKHASSCSTVLILGIGKGFLINLLLTSRKSLRKRTVLFFFGTIKMVMPILNSAVAQVPPVYMVSQFFWWGHLCVFFGTGKAWPWYGDAPSFNWKETSFVFQSPNVPSKSDSNLTRSCSNFFWWLALRCLQLFFTIHWQSALAYLASGIRVARLVASNVLNGSLAKLLFSLSARSVLEPCSSLMFLIGKVISSMVIVLLLKSSTIPNFHGFITKNEVILRLTVLSVLDYIRFWIVPFAVRVIEEVQLCPSFTLSLECPIQSIPRLWNQPFRVGKQYGLVFIYKDQVSVRTTV